MILLKIAAATAIVTLGTLLPFLPGSYDRMAAPLSEICQILGKAGLLLVPPAALWIAAEHTERFRSRRYLFALVTTVVLLLLAVIVSLAALAIAGASTAVMVAAACLYGVTLMFRRVRNSSHAPAVHADAAPAYMATVPIAVAILQLALVDRAVEFSRDRAIRNADRLIADIEQYRTARGRYPVSLLSLWRDYSPAVVGVDRYQYEPAGDAYNLLFEQLTTTMGTREIVVYNPLDQQVATSHAMDLLEFSGEALERRRGYYAVRPAKHPHWKCFSFD